MELIILGIDGAEPSLVNQWAKEGYLPNFARVMRSGAFGSLKSTIHPLTPQAWASIITGVGPGKHGIYDFGKRKKGTYYFDLVTSKQRAWPALWELLDPAKRIGVVNIPVSFPPDPVNGFFIGGMHTPTIEQGVFPENLYKELDGYVIDVMCHWYKDSNDFMADVIEMCDTRHRLIFELIKKHPVDVLFPVYVAADRVQHALWGALTKEHIERPGRMGDNGDAIFTTYKMMDDILGDYIALSDDENANLIVLSDHGFGSLKKDVYLNAVLANHGLLRFDPEKIKTFNPVSAPAAQDPTHDWQRETMPVEEVEFGDNQSLERGDVDPRYKTFETVDWSKTVAYSAGLFGNIWINQKGREPQGIIEPGAQCEEALIQIMGILEDLKDPEDGNPIVDRVYRKEEIFNGPQTEEAPDLLVKMRDYAYITRGSTEFLCNTVVSDVAVNHSGNHRMQGIVGLYGPSIKKGARLTGATVYDIAPTALHLMGQAVPKGLDGRVLTNSFSDDFDRTHPVRTTVPSKIRKTAPESLDEMQKKIVIDRLRALGYLG
jgi:predicted AlkP superfamily phosphohydrolase/phosphomutase